MTTKLTITGMSCSHCQHAVEQVLKAVPGVTDVKVNLDAGTAQVAGDARYDALAAAVQDAGYQAESAAA